MRRVLQHRLLVGVAVAASAAAGGGAYAATQSTSNPRQAFLNDVAKRLHVSPQRLDAAVKAAVIDRLNIAVRDGRLTRAQANAIKQRIERGGPPLLPPPGLGPGPGGLRIPRQLLGPPPHEFPRGAFQF